MPELPELPEVHHLHHHAHGDRFGRVIAIATVLATLSATCVAALQADALRDHSHAAALAQTMAIESLGARVSSEGSARVQLERFELAERQRGRAALARQRLLFAAPAERPGLEVQARRWESIAEETDAESLRIAKADHVEPLEPDGRFGPAADPTFPLRYLALSREHAYELEAERQVENRAVAHAEDQFAAYAVSFTMLAISTFLFAYSLTPHGRPRRRLFAGAAVLFMATAVTNAGLTALKHADHPPKAAAVAYAEGQIAADSSDPEAAVEHFTKVIELDPNFADAYVGRASAEFLAHSPLALSGGSSVTTPEALEKVIADERKARSLGIRDPLFHAELGSDLFALGLRRHDEKLLEEAVTLLEEAVRSAESDPAPAYDLGAALVALGRYREADHAFDIGVERTVYVEADGKRQLRGDPLSEEESLAVALENLQNVAEYGPRPIAARIASTKQRLIGEVAAAQIKFEQEGPGAEGGGHGAPSEGEAPAQGDHGATPEAAKPPPGEEAAAKQRAEEHSAERAPAASGGGKHAEPADAPAEPLAGVRVRLAPESMSFAIPAQAGFHPTKDRLSVQWYYQDPEKLGWTVLTEPSSVSEPPLPKGANPDYHERGPYLGLTTPASCLPSGSYRLELYVNGRLASVQAKSLDNPLVAASLHGLNAGICRPADWSQSKRRNPGLLDGFVSASGDAGTYVFSLTPSLVGTGEQPSRARMGVVLDRVLARFGDLPPARPSSPAPSPVKIASLPDALVRSYRVGGGRLLAGIGQARNGQLLVNVVFGPPELFASGDAQRIFGSLTDRT